MFLPLPRLPPSHEPGCATRPWARLGGSSHKKVASQCVGIVSPGAVRKGGQAEWGCCFIYFIFLQGFLACGHHGQEERSHSCPPFGGVFDQIVEPCEQYPTRRKRPCLPFPGTLFSEKDVNDRRNNSPPIDTVVRNMEAIFSPKFTSWIGKGRVELATYICWLGMV